MKVKKELLEDLSLNILFKGMDAEDIEKSLNSISYKVLKYKKDETVAFRGDEITGLYINLGGELAAEMMKANGEVKKIEDIDMNQIIASAFIFGNKNMFPVDLVCKSYCELLFIPKLELLKLIYTDEKILKNILDEVSNKAQFLSMKVWSTFSNKTIPEKLVNYILKNKAGDEITFKPSLKEVANLFSIARPSLSRVVGSFVDEGLLEKIGRNTYKILDQDALEDKKG